MDDKRVTEDEKIVVSVQVSFMNLSWLDKDNDVSGFLTLVKILQQTKNLAIYQTNFVKSMLTNFQTSHKDYIT